MHRELSEMTLEELWQLFPIFLTEHKLYWADWYREEEDFLKSILPSDIDFYHIGSTAINGIMAKPIIDIIIAVNSNNQLNLVAKLLIKKNYIMTSTSVDRIALNKGYTKSGFAEKVFHLHLRLKNDIDEIFFRDYLNSHQDIAKDYETLKLRLWNEFEHNRDAYTEAKTDFVNKITLLAKRKSINC